MVKVDPLKAGAAGPARQRAKRSARGIASQRGRSEGVPPNLLPLVDEIDRSGAELKRDPTGGVLERYKRAVTLFMDAAVADSLRVSSESSLGLSQKVFSTIARINVALAELVDAVLGRQLDFLKTSALVEQVKGLIVDLYR